MIPKCEAKRHYPRKVLLPQTAENCNIKLKPEEKLSKHMANLYESEQQGRNFFLSPADVPSSTTLL